MTDIAPIARIGCSVVELEPAVIDAAGNVLRAPVLQLPQTTMTVPTDAEVAEIQELRQAAAQSAASHEAETAATAVVQLRGIRDRWLAQTDYIEVYLANPTGFSPLPQAIQDAVTANKTGWVQWRQALRDLPSVQGLDQVTAVAAISAVHATTDTFPAPWPQPPAAPVIHLT